MGVEETRVSTLELFFDLVFVFTVTQLTTVVVEHPNGDGLAQVMVMLAAIWWMYAGYSWLTNVIDVSDAAHRGFLLASMAAYLVLALAIPGAFFGSGLAFGLAYLVIIVVHASLFSHAMSVNTAQAFLRVAPTNLIFAVAIVVGGALGGDAQWVIWPLSAAGLWVVPALRRAASGGFELKPSHFVERHGLVIIVALGESVVAIGIGAAGLPVDLDLVIVAVFGLALSAGLWWTYFSDEDDVQRVVRQASHDERARMGIEGFGYCHWLLLLGIVLVAAGLKKATAHPFDPASTAASVGLGGGVALFLLGDLLFRNRLGLAAGHGRALVAAAALATIPLGLVVAELQVGALVALLAALVVSRLPLRPAARAPRPASPPAQPR
jgi:low temperature requirement protein LtrA